jgi:ribosomal protein S18 acetylase RimI-like enzyme
MADGITIRDMQSGEAEELAAIAVLAWEPVYSLYQREMGADLFGRLYGDWRTHKGDQIRRACAPGASCQVLVAEQTGEVVGFCTYRASIAPGVGELDNNAVRPSHQGQGIAPRLYEEAFARLRAQGMAYVCVRTGLDDAHAPARRAYEKAGFDIALPRVDYYRALD